MLRIRLFAIASLGSLLAFACQHSSSNTASPPSPQPRNATGAAALLQQPSFAIEPSERLPASPALLIRGATIFQRQCAPCHGASGTGDGDAAYLLYPKPRNFKKGPYRFVTTWEGVPTDDDLYRVISRGIPGSAMPSWAHLPERDRWALVNFVKSLSETPLQISPPKAADPVAGNPGEGVIDVSAEPPLNQASLQKGAELFATTCAPCHGPRGQGDGPNSASLKDDDGIPIRPRDLTTGVFKGAPRGPYLYARVVRGIPGTPMPMTPSLTGDDAWHVVHYIRSLSSDLQRERAEMKRFRIPVVRVAKLPDHPDSGEWRAAPKVELHLMPLWWRYDRPEYLTVRAVHDGKEVAIQLLWSDVTNDNLVMRPQDFRDAAAIELTAAGDDPPFFAMGEKGRFVDIWMWKSERQADIPGFHDLEAQYPNVGIDSYPNLMRAPYEQPLRHALTLESDTSFITAWGAGNIVADPTRRSAAEDLRAQGFGTLKPHPGANPSVRADGVYSNGAYRVVFRRTLAPNAPDAVDLRGSDSFLTAFAVWNGSAGDRDGKKSVTIWQELVFLR